MKLRILASLLTLVPASIIGQAAPANAAVTAKIFAQQPCATSTGYCSAFTNAFAGAIFSLAFYIFKAPGKGSAAASVMGTAYCSNAGPNPAVVDFVTQVSNSDNAPNPSGPGGLRQAGVLAGHGSATFNLASTRTFPINKAGNFDILLLGKELLLNAGVTCYVYDTAFTVVFIP